MKTFERGQLLRAGPSDHALLVAADLEYLEVYRPEADIRRREHSHVVRDQEGRLALHDEVDLDHVPRTVVVHDAGIDRLDLVGERHRLVGDQVLEVERGGFAGEVLEVGRAGASPGEDEDDCLPGEVRQFVFQCTRWS